MNNFNASTWEELDYAKLTGLLHVGENKLIQLNACALGCFFTTKLSGWVGIYNKMPYGGDCQTPSDLWEGSCNFTFHTK